MDETGADDGRAGDWATMPEGSGVMAIRSRSSGRSYFVGVTDMRQRAYDHLRLLNLGLHHNPELQTAWTADPNDWEFVMIERVTEVDLLPVFKQVWISRTPGSFNKKNSVRRHRM